MSKSVDFEKTVSLPVSMTDAFAYHERPGALDRLVPPWESIRVVQPPSGLEVGTRVELKKYVLGIPFSYVARHSVYQPPHRFQDVQESGPFRSWQHDHIFTAAGDDRSTLTDRLQIQLPGGGLAASLGRLPLRRMLQQMFAYRHVTTANDLQLTRDYSLAPQRVALSGSSGLVGTALRNFLSLQGHHIQPIVRGAAAQPGQLAVWDHHYSSDALQDIDVVIHLAGKSIADSRWSTSVKNEIRDSRVEKTRQLCQRLANLPDRKPRVLLCASATGFYGQRDAEELTEESPRGDGFLPEVSEQWEAACQPAIDAGIRVVHLRFGIVLSPQGGALAKMLTPAKLFGGRLGSGGQWWSWIALDDVLAAVYHAMAKDDLQGPVNIVAPRPITNADFVRVLGKVLQRPPLVPAPAFALRLALGEMADPLLLGSARVVPQRLLQTGFRFQFPDLEGALRHMLGRVSVD